MAPIEKFLSGKSLRSADQDAKPQQYSAWLEGDQFNVAKKPVSAPPPPSNSSSMGMKLSLSLIAAVVIAGAIMLFEPFWHMVGPVEVPEGD